VSAASEAAELTGVRLLFHEDWYDGPLTGLAEYQGRTYFYEAVWDDAADDWTHPRRLVLREVPDSEIEEEWRDHRAFERHVGTMHCGHLDAAERVQRPQRDWSRFYKNRPDKAHDRHAHRPVVGTFTV
jgi:hypothetical protein